MSSEKARSETNAPRTLRILLAEDYEMNRQIIRAYLKPYGYHIEEVVNGEEAVETFKAQSFDLVLMDIQMAPMDGYSATRMIRAWECEHGRTAVPIVALTAHAYDEDIRKSLDAGCTAHLGKPIEKKMLFETIANLTAETRIEADDRPQVTATPDLQHLIPRFVADMNTSCHSIAAAVLQDDLEAIAKVCHRIKGAGGIFGFHELSRIAAALEAAALSGDRVETKRLSAEMEKHLAEVKIHYK